MDVAPAPATPSATSSGSPPRSSRSTVPAPSPSFPRRSSTSVSSPAAPLPPAPALSPESYRAIARLAPRRRDLATLCLVSRAFSRAALPIMYNTLSVNDAEGGARVCETLVASKDVARLVRAITVQVWPRPSPGKARAVEEIDESDSEAEEEDDEASHYRNDPDTDAEFWTLIAHSLVNTTRLRHLVIDIPSPNSDGVECAWALGGTQCAFRLHTFHCDFDWDANLVAFLDTQDELYDLYVRDFRDLTLLALSPASASTSPPLLPALTTLECTFSEAAVLLAPGRPLSRLKTAFSTPPHLANREPELRLLVSALRRCSAPLHALDVGDAPVPGATAEAEAASMQLLQRVAHARAMTMAHELRYFGTLILPVGGRKRLQFYGILMRLPSLRCVELDVTAWTPAPSSSPALRALAAELRLYCKGVLQIVFVHGDDFQRTVVAVDPGTGVLKIDRDAVPEHFWREI
ncbi:hypothetical protein C8F01DRAFT_217628 [Mycena amicta]|nr:hypothetical protein C8F01DRAFT_217628 [Mycena amicta]